MPFAGPVSTTCTVEEDGSTRTFRVTLEPAAPPTAAAQPSGQPAAVPAARSGGNRKVPVFSPFKGKVELVELKVKIGETVKEGQVVAAVEAMKAKHDVRAPAQGQVVSIDADLGADVVAGQPILTIGQ